MDNLRASGANVTEKHIVEVSLCTMFLMQAAKRADNDFKVSPQSTSHTVRDSASDIVKMMTHLTDKQVITENSDHSAPIFCDPLKKGFDSLCKPAWIKAVLSEEQDSGEQTAEDRSQDEVIFDYELSDIS